jgi:hypothetical protein
MYNSGNSSKNVTGSSVVDGTLENADYADNGLSGDKIDGGTLSNVNVDDTTAANIIAQVDDNEISGDKIDGGIISNFQSTGIDDRLPTGKVLTLSDSGVDVTGNFEHGHSYNATRPDYVSTIRRTTTGSVSMDYSLNKRHSSWTPGLFRITAKSNSGGGGELNSAWWLVNYRLYNGTVYSSTSDSGGSTGNFTLAITDEGGSSPMTVRVTLSGMSDYSIVKFENIHYGGSDSVTEV